jgi:hypothetical protein
MELREDSLTEDALAYADPAGHCGVVLPNSCGKEVACFHLDDYGVPMTQTDGLGGSHPIELARALGDDQVMAAGESWWIGCVVSGAHRSLAGITPNDAVRGSITPSDIRLLPN